MERVRLVRVAAKQLGAGGFRLGPGAGFVGRDGAAKWICNSDREIVPRRTVPRQQGGTSLMGLGVALRAYMPGLSCG
jgi:hypothetical protein